MIVISHNMCFLKILESLLSLHPIIVNESITNEWNWKLGRSSICKQSKLNHMKKEPKSVMVVIGRGRGRPIKETLKHRVRSPRRWHSTFEMKLPHNVSNVSPDMLRQRAIIEFVFHKLHIWWPTMWVPLHLLTANALRKVDNVDTSNTNIYGLP